MEERFLVENLALAENNTKIFLPEKVLAGIVGIFPGQDSARKTGLLSGIPVSILQGR